MVRGAKQRVSGGSPSTRAWQWRRSVVGERAAVGGKVVVVPPPVGEEVRRARRAEHGEVEDERDDLGAAVERGRNDVAVGR